MRSLLSIASLAFLPAPLPAQAFLDAFSYPNGTAVPGWTQQRGVWQVQNGRLSSTSGWTWAYITRDGLSATRCVLDGEFFFVGSGTQFGGLTTRHPGGNVDSNLLLVKVQENGGAPDFDRVFSYERGVALGPFFASIPGGTLSARCRMVTLQSEFWIETDADRDGIYELALPRRPITTPLNGTLLGMSALGTTEMDNFAYFDAVLLPRPGSAPRLGTVYRLDLGTSSPSALWLGMLALGNGGFAIGNRRIPVNPDFLAIGSFGNPALGLAGATDTAGDATLAIPILADPILVGLRVFACAFTFDAAMPFGVGQISNEHGFAIAP